jgi:hypothetical protein
LPYIVLYWYLLFFPVFCSTPFVLLHNYWDMV